MSQRVEVVVDDAGHLQVEFIGFVGDDCYEEAQRIRGALSRLGLQLDLQELVPKAMEQMLAEAGAEPDPGSRRIAGEPT